MLCGNGIGYCTAGALYTDQHQQRVLMRWAISISLRVHVLVIHHSGVEVPF